MQDNKKQFNETLKNILKSIYIITTQTLQTIVIASVAIYFGKFVEFLWMAIGFHIGRAAITCDKQHNKTYHAPTLLTCTVLSATLFGMMCAIVPTTKQSLIIQSIFGVGLAYLMWLVEYIRERLKDGKRSNDSR